jgi:hypothetical protein
MVSEDVVDFAIFVFFVIFVVKKSVAVLRAA